MIQGVDLGVTSIPTGALTKLKSIILTPGLWIVELNCIIPAVSGTDTQKYRNLSFCNPNGNAIIYTNQVSNEANVDYLNLIHIIRVQTQADYYLSVMQASGSAMNMNAGASIITAYRLS